MIGQRTPEVAVQVVQKMVNILHGCRTATWQAHLRSHSGRNAGAALSHAPTAPEFKIPPHLSRVLFLERLRLPLPLTEKQYTACHEPLDHFGCHRAALLATDYMFMGEDRTPMAILGGYDGLTRGLFADVVLCKGHESWLRRKSTCPQRACNGPSESDATERPRTEHHQRQTQSRHAHRNCNRLRREPSR